MRYHAFACDYDSTLATHGAVGNDTLAALERLKASGRSIVLVTGRVLDDLLEVFPRAAVFDRIVLENGAQIFRPETRETELLAEPPPPEFLARLRALGVTPLAAGRIVVATREPFQSTVLETIREMGLEMHLVFNKGGVMALPAGVDKATGLRKALAELGLSPHNAVGIGDAENDHAFLELCECSVAVSNALPALQERADWVTRDPASAGVVELIGRLLENDLADLEPRLARHEIPMGATREGAPLAIPPYGRGVLLAGSSGGGKSTFASGVLECMGSRGYQYCILDSEGDYAELEHGVVLGTARRPPSIEEALALLDVPAQSLAVNLLGFPIEQRPKFFQEMLAALVQLRWKRGRPHWILIDEAHHLLPPGAPPSDAPLPDRLGGVFLVTVHPEKLAPAALSWVDLALACGDRPEETLQSFARAAGRPPPEPPSGAPVVGEMLEWWPSKGSTTRVFRSIPARASIRRHLRKQAEGELGADKSFYFRGPEGRPAS